MRSVKTTTAIRRPVFCLSGLTCRAALYTSPLPLLVGLYSLHLTRCDGSGDRRLREGHGSGLRLQVSLTKHFLPTYIAVLKSCPPSQLSATYCSTKCARACITDVEVAVRAPVTSKESKSKKENPNVFSRFLTLKVQTVYTHLNPSSFTYGKSFITTSYSILYWSSTVLLPLSCAFASEGRTGPME